MPHCRLALFEQKKMRTKTSLSNTGIYANICHTHLQPPKKRCCRSGMDLERCCSRLGIGRTQGKNDFHTLRWDVDAVANP